MVTGFSKMMALNLQEETQAPQRLHLLKSITAFFSKIFIAEKGQLFTQREQPVHFSKIIFIDIFRPDPFLKPKLTFPLLLEAGL